MATYSSILARESIRTEEPGGLQSMGSQRIGHDLATKQQQSHKANKWKTLGSEPRVLPLAHLVPSKTLQEDSAGIVVTIMERLRCKII